MIQRLAHLLAALALLALLAGCTAAAEPEEELGRGQPTPMDAVESFVENLNDALADPQLADPEVRNRWADQLASRFAPSERQDQRQVMRAMLAGFVASGERPVVGSRVTMQISFSDIEVLRSSEDEALVHLVDGSITLRWTNEGGEVLRERTSNLMTVLGGGEGLPVLRVDGQWFMTEG